MPGHDIIVIGASIGGLDALRALLPGLPRDLPAALFLVWHLAPDSHGVLPDLLQAVSPLPIANAQDGEAIRPGRIYVAPPDRHLVLEPGRVRLSRGPKENRFRPAVDPLFRSAAAAYGPRVVGVVLSGALDDGTAGLWAIKDRGGVALVQDPLDAVEPSMPHSAHQHVVVDQVASAQALGLMLDDLARTPVAHAGGTPMSDQLHIETRIALEDTALQPGVLSLGSLTPFTCPACHGTLVEVAASGVLRFRCHTGHAYTVNTLLAEIAQSIEESLWGSVRAIEERVLLLHRVADHLRSAQDAVGADTLLGHAREAEQQAQLVRLVLLRRSQAPSDARQPITRASEHGPHHP